MFLNALYDNLVFQFMGVFSYARTSEGELPFPSEHKSSGVLDPRRDNVMYLINRTFMQARNSIQFNRTALNFTNFRSTIHHYPLY